MASLALRSARPWRAMACEIDLRGARAAPAACAALCGAAGGRRAAADVDRLLVANRAMLAAPRIGAARRRRRALATTGHRAAACDQHDTRRHTATSARQRERPTRHSPPHGDIDADDVAAAAAGCAARFSYGVSPSAALKDQQYRGPRLPARAESSRARARGAALAARARGWCATAPRFKQLR